MLDNEETVFQSISDGLRQKYDGIFIVGTEITSAPPRFPAVTVVQNDNEVNTRYSSFDNRENVVIEEYKIEVYSNLKREHGRVEQAKAIAEDVADIMNVIGYVRTFNHPVANADQTVARRVLRFRKTNLTALEDY